MDLLHQILWINGIGLACAWTATAHIDAWCRSTGGNHNGGAGLPPAARPLKVADVDAGDVGDGSEWQLIGGAPT